MTVETADYTPEKVEQQLRHWQELRSAAEGGTGSLAGQGAGRGGRMSLVAMVADLERAADQLPLVWSATADVYEMQDRLDVWRRRIRLEFTRHDKTVQDVPLAWAWTHMATTLGWQPDV